MMIMTRDDDDDNADELIQREETIERREKREERREKRQETRDKREERREKIEDRRQKAKRGRCGLTSCCFFPESARLLLVRHFRSF